MKPNPVPGHWAGRFKDGFERVYHFTKLRGYKFYPNRMKIEPCRDFWRERSGGREYSATGSGLTRNFDWKPQDGLVLPSNVLTLSTESHNQGHPAVFPMKLPEWFIRLLSDEGDVVLDPFLGSGTTYSAALKLGRKAVGIEINEEYIALAKKKLLSQQKSLDFAVDMC